MKWRYSVHLLVSLGDLWLARGDPAKARAFADEALEIADRTNSRKYVAWGWRLRGNIAVARRQWDEAEGALRRAVTVAQSLDNPRQQWLTQLALGHFYEVTRKPESARASHAAAHDIVDRVKANVHDPRLRASLDRAPVARQVSPA
jgi:hypothetical protein